MRSRVVVGAGTWLHDAAHADAASHGRCASMRSRVPASRHACARNGLHWLSFLVCYWNPMLWVVSCFMLLMLLSRPMLARHGNQCCWLHGGTNCLHAMSSALEQPSKGSTTSKGPSLL